MEPIIYSHRHSSRDRELNLILAAREKKLKPGATYGPVIRDFLIVECCTGGKGAASINGKMFPLQKGDCIFLCPGDIVIHYADWQEPREGIWCEIDGMMVRDLLSQARISADQPFAPREAFEPICALIEEMLLLKNETDAGVELRRNALAMRLFGELLRFRAAPESRTKYVRQAITFIESNYFNPLSVAKIAEALGLDRSYFTTLFSRETGVSPHFFLNAVRVRKACALMRDGGCGISEAAEAVGLDPQSFARVFRQHQNITPREFLKRQKAGAE